VYRATRRGATLLLSCFSDANLASAQEWPRPAVSEDTLRDVLGGTGWDITSLEPATVRGALDGGPLAEMAFWYLRAQRTLAALTAVLPSTTTESGAFRIRLRCA